jgi:uncharacterized protein YggE
MNSKTVFLALIAPLILLATACGDNGDTYVQTGNAPVTGINAMGTGEAFGEPDVLIVNIGVSAQRASIAEAREAAAAAQQGVIDSLKRNGVAAKDIQTIQFSVNPQYDFRSGSQQITGYVVSNVVTAKIRDLAKAGTAIDAAIEAGGNDAVVQGVQFGIDDPAELQKQAREQAVKKAKEQAQQLADNAGVKLGKLLSISESSSSVPIAADVIRAPATGDAITESPIEAGQLTVRITVVVLYAVD